MPQLRLLAIATSRARDAAGRSGALRPQAGPGGPFAGANPAGGADRAWSGLPVKFGLHRPGGLDALLGPAERILEPSLEIPYPAWLRMKIGGDLAELYAPGMVARLKIPRSPNGHGWLLMQVLFHANVL